MIMIEEKDNDITEEEYLEEKRNECGEYTVNELNEYFTGKYDSHDDNKVRKHLERCESCGLKALKVGTAKVLTDRFKLSSEH